VLQQTELDAVLLTAMWCQPQHSQWYTISVYDTTQL